MPSLVSEKILRQYFSCDDKIKAPNDSLNCIFKEGKVIIYIYFAYTLLSTPSDLP